MRIPGVEVLLGKKRRRKLESDHRSTPKSTALGRLSQGSPDENPKQLGVIRQETMEPDHCSTYGA